MAAGALFGCTASGVDDGSGSDDKEESSQSRCSDHEDNDGDGAVDCADPNCRRLEVCGVGTGRDPAICAEAMVAADVSYSPVNIIWAIDGSGSMSDEADIVQSNLNGFAYSLGDAFLQFRLILVTNRFVVVPPPLGTQDPRFLFVEQPYAAEDELAQLLQHFESYRSFLIPGAVTHFIGVSDGNSTMSSSDFRQQMEAKLGRSFVFHAIASENTTHCLPSEDRCLFEAPGCRGPNGTAWGPGFAYYDVAGTTGGRTFSICTSDWSGLFATLTSAIRTSVPLPCDFPVPTEELSIDFNKVNVQFTPTAGSPRTVPFAGSGDCGQGGWVYDNAEAPTKIILCPSTCENLSADTHGRIEIVFGCETILI